MNSLTLVLKVGGSLLGAGVSSTILEDVKKYAGSDHLIVVHGGGDEVTSLAERMGKPQKFLVSPEGIRSRYTDRETVELFAMVLAGKLNKEIVAALQRIGLKALGLSGVDAGLIRAVRKKRLIALDERGRKRIVEGGFTGKITGVNGELLSLLLSHGYLPVVAPLALGEEYEFLNVDGDRAAAYLAGGVQATRLVFLTDVDGVLLDGRLLPKLSLGEAETLIPRIGSGMDKKVFAAIEALKMGVTQAIICSGLISHPMFSMLNGGAATIIEP